MLSVFLAGNLFAQKIQAVGVTDSDCKAFSNNFEKIYKQLDFLDDQTADYTAKKYAKYETMLEGCGISGPNRVAKVAVINLCLGIFVAEEEIQSDPAMAAMMKKMGMDPTAQLKQQIDAKDFETINKNKKLFQPVIKYLKGSQGMFSDDSDDNDEDPIVVWQQERAANANKEKAKQEAEIATAKAEYKANLDYAKKLKKKLTSSKTDGGMLYTEMDKKRASKYKLVMSSETMKPGKFSDEQSFVISYDSDYYRGEIVFVAETGCIVNYNFTDFMNYKGEADYADFTISEQFTLNVTKVEFYSPGNIDQEGEVVIYTKDAGVIHFWYDKTDKAVLRCGGLGTVEGTHRTSMP